MWYRFDHKISQKVLRWLCVVTLVVKLWPSIIQNDVKYNFDDIESIITLRIVGSIQHLLSLLPLICAFPRGAIAAAMAILGLWPDAVTPRVLVMYFYPFATLLLLLGSSSIAQIAGDWILASALTFYFVGDFLMYASYKHIIDSKIEKLLGGQKAKAS